VCVISFTLYCTEEIILLTNDFHAGMLSLFDLLPFERLLQECPGESLAWDAFTDLAEYSRDPFTDMAEYLESPDS